MKPSTTLPAIFALVVVALLAWFFLRSTPQLSDEGYQVSMALLRACNQQDRGAVEKIKNTIDTMTTEGKLGPNDVAAVNQILELAQKNQWQKAAAQVRELMLQQSQPVSYPALEQ